MVGWVDPELYEVSELRQFCKMQKIQPLISMATTEGEFESDQWKCTSAHL